MSRRGAQALAVVVFIAAVTASWWALALWPMPATTPGWLVRTRLACFGTAADGLPNAGGWLLLVGEPLGMLGLLSVVWGDALREGIHGLTRAWWGRGLLACAAVCLLSGAGWVGHRVREARGQPFDATAGAAPVALDAPAPPLRLVDQHGDTIALGHFPGRPVLVVFAYGHCETVCPVIVHDLLEAGQQLRGRAPELLIVTLDPWRDTPARLPAIAEGWGLAARGHVLSGPVEAVERVLDDWGVGRARDRTSGEVAHQRLAYLVGADGRLAYRLDGSTAAVVAAIHGLRAADARR